MTDRTTRIAGRIESSRTFHALARLGFVVNGLLHVLIGGIAISVAEGARGQEADQSGALEQLAATPGGVVVLWIAVVGFVALGAWEILQVIVAPRGGRRSRWAIRVSKGAQALVYLALGGTAFVFARGSSYSSRSTSRHLSAAFLDAPGGVFALVALGLTVLGIGIWFIVSGITHAFAKEIRTPTGAPGVVVTIIGAVGYIAQGIAVGVVGILFVVGAVTYDPGSTTGLDGALKSLAMLPFGEVVLFAVGIGLIVYGIYCGIRARLQKLSS